MTTKYEISKIKPKLFIKTKVNETNSLQDEIKQNVPSVWSTENCNCTTGRVLESIKQIKWIKSINHQTNCPEHVSGIEREFIETRQTK